MTKKSSPTLVLFPLLGLATFAAGSTFFALARDEIHGQIAYTLLYEASIIFFTALIVERLLLAEFEEHVVEVVDSKFEAAVNTFTTKATQSIGEVLRDAVRLIDRAEEARLEDILPPRRHTERKAETNARIQKSLRATGKVKLCCTSGRDFFEINAALRSIFYEKAKPDHASEEYRIRILLCDPEGWITAVRQSVEAPNDSDWLKRDIAGFVSAIKGLRTQFAANRSESNWSLDAKYYNFLSPAWFVITDSEIFLEVYHLGDIRNLDSQEADDCIGGRVQILVFGSESETYCAFERFHDLLWKQDKESLGRSEFAVRNIPELEPMRAA
jgi:hypothetical protein